MPDTASGPVATLRSGYRPPAFLIDTVDLRFELDPGATLVKSRLTLRRNPAHGDPNAPLHLVGEHDNARPTPIRLIQRGD